MKGTMLQTSKNSKQPSYDGGVTGVRVTVVDAAVAASELPQVKLDGVSMLNNFEFFEDTVKVWRAFDVGKGKKISISKLQGKGEDLKIE